MKQTTMDMLIIDMKLCYRLTDCIAAVKHNLNKAKEKKDDCMLQKAMYTLDILDHLANGDDFCAEYIEVDYMAEILKEAEYLFDSADDDYEEE